MDLLTKQQLKALSKGERTLLTKSKQENLKYTDSSGIKVAVVKKAQNKADASVDKDSIEVTIVCNTTQFCDSHMDVLIKGCYDQTLEEVGLNVPHIQDHIRKSTAHVGDVTALYTKELDLTELGLEATGTVESLVMESTVRKAYDEKVFNFYNLGKINQHSIGLQYKELLLAIDSNHEDDKEEKAVWDKYYEGIVNKEAVTRGYFWAVPAINLIENSCVLFGANSLTPTLEAKTKTNSSTNKTKPVTTKGITMTLEEALVKNAELTADLATVKAELATKGTTAITEERTRILGVMKAAKTLNQTDDLLVKQIGSGATVKAATELFTIVQEAVQKANPLPTTDPLNPTLNTDTTGGSFMDAFSAELGTDKSDATWGDL